MLLIALYTAKLSHKWSESELQACAKPPVLLREV